MNEDLPDFLPPIVPPPASPELRTRVLAAVESELSVRQPLRHLKPRWERAFEWSVAASLFLGIGLSAWRWQVDEPHRLAANDRRPQAVSEIAELVAWATDVETGRAVARSLQANWEPEPIGGIRDRRLRKSQSRSAQPESQL